MPVIINVANNGGTCIINHKQCASRRFSARFTNQQLARVCLIGYTTASKTTTPTAEKALLSHVCIASIDLINFHVRVEFAVDNMHIVWTGDWNLNLKPWTGYDHKNDNKNYRPTGDGGRLVWWDFLFVRPRRWNTCKIALMVFEYRVWSFRLSNFIRLETKRRGEKFAQTITKLIRRRGGALGRRSGALGII